MASKYVQGKSMPKQELAEKLFSVLGVKYKTLEDLMNNL